MFSRRVEKLWEKEKLLVTSNFLFSNSAFQKTCTADTQKWLQLPYHSSYNDHIWYEGTSHQYASAGTKVKVEYQGYISQKMAVSGALVFHKHILFMLEYSMKIKLLQQWHMHLELFLYLFQRS